MPEMNIRKTMHQMKTRADDGSKAKIAGYFIVYNTLSEPIWDWYKEEVQPGASKSSLDKVHRDDIAGLNSHLSHLVLGSTKAGTMELREDNIGLYGEIDPPNNTYANDLMVSLERGDIDSASFGFYYVTTTWRLQDDWDILEVRDMDIIELTVCKFPAFKATQIGIRSFLEKNKDVEREALPLLCRAFNRLENNLDMNQDDMSNILQYRSLLHDLLPEQRKTILSRVAPERRTWAAQPVLNYIDVIKQGMID